MVIVICENAIIIYSAVRCDEQPLKINTLLGEKVPISLNVVTLFIVL